MTRPVEYLRSRSLPLLALVEAARIVFARHSGYKHFDSNAQKNQRVTTIMGPQSAQPSGNPGQLRLEGMR